MAITKKQLDNLIPAKKGEVRNPNGRPKGSMNLSSHIQNMLNDEDFEVKLEDGTLIKMMPVKAIIQVAIKKSLDGDTRAMEWLAKHGYGIKIDANIKIEAAQTAVEDLADQDDNVSAWAKDKLAKATPGQIVEADPSLQDQE